MSQCRKRKFQSWRCSKWWRGGKDGTHKSFTVSISTPEHQTPGANVGRSLKSRGSESSWQQLVTAAGRPAAWECCHCSLLPPGSSWTVWHRSHFIAFLHDGAFRISCFLLHPIHICNVEATIRSIYKHNFRDSDIGRK